MVFWIGSGSIIISSAIIPGVRQTMRGVSGLDPPMKIETFDLRPVFGVKSEILQPDARQQDDIIMPLAIRGIVP